MTVAHKYPTSTVSFDLTTSGLLRPSEGKRAVVYELVTRNTFEVAQARRRRRGLVTRSSGQL